jgi:hypothetical protein
VKESLVLPVVVRACVASAHQLAAAAALPPDDNPMIAAKRRDLEQLQELARRNPALMDAVMSLETEIKGMQARPRQAPDLAPYEAMMQDPQFFDVASPEDQREIFGAMLAGVHVGVGGRLISPIPRTF